MNMLRDKLAQLTLITLVGLPLVAQELGDSGSEQSGSHADEGGKETALGRQLAAEMRRRTTAIANLKADDYLKRLTARVAAQIPNAREPFTFILNADDPCSKTYQPEALPGGYIFVRSALLAESKDKAEFEGMLARVMEPITLESFNVQQTHNRTTDVASMVFFLVGDCSGPGAVGSRPQISPDH